ncbi:Integrator complex subunit 7 [Actinomortierella ambigua]|nr:Integrator complex subunit 7 [Actinomortierella ambigua]
MANPKSGALSDEAGFKRLVVLESEYRTHRPADQLHAIASFPQLFEEFPNPVIINSAFLKLADYFRGTTNVQRHAILQVFKKSEAHLKLILNVEETIKRISPMLQSNDPLGRAITLRVLGCMASIVHDRVDVYHNVIHCLDSTEAMEVSAAIYVADRICAHSQKFCAIISGKLAFMIRDPKVALPFKRRLIRIFGHMFEDITLARLIELLLQMAWSHGAGIRRVALMCLGSLASQTIEFEPSQVKMLFDIASASGDEKTSIRAMSVLVRLFQSTFLVSGLILEDGGEQTLIQFLQQALSLLSQEHQTTATSSAAMEETFKLVCTMLECYRSVVEDGSADLAKLCSVFEESLQAVVERLRDYLVLACKAILTANAVRTSPDPEPFVRKMTDHVHRFGGWNSMTEQYTTRGCHWHLYQIGRAALRTGWPSLALVALQSLSAYVETVPYRQWISAVQELAQAEAFLSGAHRSSSSTIGSTGGGGGGGVVPLDLSMPQQLYARTIGRLEEMEVYPSPPPRGGRDGSGGGGGGSSGTSGTSGISSSSSGGLGGSGAMDRTFQLQYCHLRSRFLQTCRRALILLDQGPSAAARPPQLLPPSSSLLLQCASSLNEMAHQYTLMKLQVAHHAPSEAALEVLQTSCLSLAFAIQRVARATTRVMKRQEKTSGSSSGAGAGAGAGSSMMEMDPPGGPLAKGKEGPLIAEMEVFDVDPLLIPLLYTESTESVQGGSTTLTSTSSSGNNNSGGVDQTAMDLFRASVRRLLRYVVETTTDDDMDGGDTDKAARSIERRCAVARQAVLQLVSMPIPFPARFFNHL